MARNPNGAANVGACNVPRGYQGFDIVGIRHKSAIPVEERGEPIARGACAPALAPGPGQGGPCNVATIEEDLDARRAPRCGFAESLGALLAKRRQHTLGVLAGSKSVGAMIDATAGIGEAFEIADFNLVEAPASGLDAKRAEN